VATATLLLPARSRFAAAALPDDVTRALGRATTVQVAPGERAQLTRHFTVAAPHWPVAALTRQRDVGDAAGASWLRADPACMVPDMHGARMMAYGETLRPTLADCLALLPVLQPLFADAGFMLDAPDPSRWYLRLPIDLALPDFDSPDGEGGRRWRALMTEAQVLLHNHSWNQQRASQGQQPINSLWFWGGGVMPVSVSTPHAQVRSRDALLQGLALAAGVAVDGEQAVDALVDLRQLRSLQQLGNDAIRPLLAALKRGELQRLVLDFEDGLQFQLDRGQRWQFWKKPRQLHE